jgi:sensor domain CHASE-containing protein
MHVIPVLWIVWGVFAAILLALLRYRGTITRYEDDQLFLDDISERQHKENDAIIRKLNTIQPFLRVFTGVTSILTATIIGIYAWDAIKTFYM